MMYSEVPDFWVQNRGTIVIQVFSVSMKQLPMVTMLFGGQRLSVQLSGFGASTWQHGPVEQPCNGLPEAGDGMFRAKFQGRFQNDQME